MPNPWQRLRRALERLGMLEARASPDSPTQPSLRLVAPPTFGSGRPDPLLAAARELVQSIDNYNQAWDRRFERRMRPSWSRCTWLGRHTETMILGPSLRRAWLSYYEQASASSDPFHREMAELLAPPQLSIRFSRAIPLLRNAIREEPDLDLEPAEPWLALLPKAVSISVLATRSYTSVLTIESKHKLSQPVVIVLDLGVEIDSASVSLDLEREPSSTRTDLFWRESRIWLTIDEPRLRAGDRLSITVSTAKAITRQATIRIHSPQPAHRARFIRLAASS